MKLVMTKLAERTRTNQSLFEKYRTHRRAFITAQAGVHYLWGGERDLTPTRHAALSAC